MKRVSLTVASLLFGVGIGALLQALRIFGFENGAAALNGAAILSLVHLTLLLPPLLIGALLATRLPADSRVVRLLGMSPLRWSLAIALGPVLSTSGRDLLGLTDQSSGLGLFLLGIGALVLFLRVLPTSPWRAPLLQYAGGILTLMLAASAFGGLSLGTHTKAPLAASGIVVAAGTPDIVLVSVDTLRADALDAPGLELPTLEFLAENGMRRARALAPSPYTLPSHVSLLSGLTPLQHGTYSNFHEITEEVDTLAEALQRRGYLTRAVVSNEVLSRNTGIAQGFDSYDDSRVAMNALLVRAQNRLRQDTWLRWMPKRRELIGRLTGEGLHAAADSTTRLAVEGLRSLRDADRPFFYFIHYMDPHLPYEPDPSVRGTYSDAAQPPHRFGKGIGTHQELDAIAALLPERNAAALETLEYYRQTYLEELLFVDRQLGLLLAEIRANGRPTLLLFTGDHGEHFGEYGLVAHGNSLHWPLLDVPWILWSKEGLPTGLEVPEVPRLEDARRILFAGAGLASEEDFPYELPEEYIAHWQTPPEISLSTGTWKLIARYLRMPDGSLDFAEVRYYDLNQDPGETVNVADAHPEAVIEMLKKAIRHLEAAVPGEVQELGDLQRAKLMALGYAES